MVTGEIKVRDSDLVKWSAQRQGGISDGMAVYHVTTTGWHRGIKFTAEFDVQHVVNAGPFILSMMIMTEIDRHMMDMDLEAAS
jgi:hypothetical protein